MYFLSLPISCFRSVLYIYSFTLVFIGGINIANTAFQLEPIDFIQDFSQNNLAAGATYTTGNTANMYWRGENNQSSSAFQLDSETVAEVCGIELFGPNTGSYREKLKYVRMVIDGKEIGNISLNELMAPGLTNNQSDPMGWREPPMRIGIANTMFGRPLLLGGDPCDATPKIGPGQTLSIKVAAHNTTEGGSATLTTPMRIRLWMLKCKGVEKVRSILAYQSANSPYMKDKFNGNMVDCSFQLGDLETMDQPTTPITPYEKMVGNSNGFQLADWTELPGGLNASKPTINNFITYGQNAAATVANSFYTMTQDGVKVNEDWNVLRWNLDKKTAIRIDSVGVLPHKNLRYVRMWRSGRGIEFMHEVQVANNPLQLPCGLYITGASHYGPTPLPRPFLIWNEIGSIEAEDNGTSIPAWSATNRGFLIGIYGKKYELE